MGLVQRFRVFLMRRRLGTSQAKRSFVPFVFELQAPPLPFPPTGSSPWRLASLGFGAGFRDLGFG